MTQDELAQNATLELCDSICDRHDTEELCEAIVAQVELTASEFAKTLSDDDEPTIVRVVDRTTWMKFLQA